MDRDATFLFALVMLTFAALSVSASGWVLFTRDHRAWKTANAATDVTHPEPHQET
jgi:hypothetical protein